MRHVNAEFFITPRSRPIVISCTYDPQFVGLVYPEIDEYVCRGQILNVAQTEKLTDRYGYEILMACTQWCEQDEYERKIEQAEWRCGDY